MCDTYNCDYLKHIAFRFNLIDFQLNTDFPPNFAFFTVKSPRCAMVFGGVVSRDGLGLGRIGTPGNGAHRSVAMAPMFKGIRFGRHHFCSEVWEVVR